MKNVGYYNGKLAPIEEISIPMNDRVVYFGDGVYDAAYIYRGKPFALDVHLDRFYSSCRLLQIAFELPRAELEAILLDICSKLDGDSGMLYWQATRGTEPRNHVFPTDPPLVPNLLAYAVQKPLPNMKKRVNLITVEDKRYEFCNIKTLNLIPNVLAVTAAEHAGCQEAVFHRGQTVTECSHSNVSILKNGTFITHPLDEFILPGTVRRQTLDLCASLGIPTSERTFTLAELFDADEVILTSATAMIRSASTIDSTPVGGRAQETLERLQDAYSELVFGRSGDTGDTRLS